MKENLKLGVFRWFGGYNRKIGKINNRGVVEYIDSSEELIKIFQFSDDTKNLDEDEYESLTDKPIISFNKNNRRYIYLIEDEEAFFMFTIEELKNLLIKLTKIIVNDKKNKNELNIGIYKMCEVIIKILLNKGENLDFLYLNDDFNFKYIDFGHMFSSEQYEENLQKFAKKDDLIILYYLFNTNHRPYLWGREDEYKEDILNLIDNKEEYYDLEESIEICKKINSTSDSDKNTNIDLEIDCDKEVQNLEILENNNITRVQEYINHNWILENANSIKYFLEYIENYSFEEELENLFIKQIIDFVKEKLSTTYSLKKLLSYFDGSIIFNNEENNRLYEELRLEIFKTNKIFIKLIKDMALSLAEDSEELCNSFKEDETNKIIYNRIKYTNISEDNYDEFNKLERLLVKNIKCVNDFENGKDIVEAINFIIFVIGQKIQKENCNHTMIMNTEKTLGFKNLLKLVGLFTGVKVIELEKNITLKTNKYFLFLTQVEKMVNFKEKEGNEFNIAFSKESTYGLPNIEDVFRTVQNADKNTWWIHIDILYQGIREYEHKYYNYIDYISDEEIELLKKQKIEQVRFLSKRINKTHFKWDNTYTIRMRNKFGKEITITLTKCTIENELFNSHKNELLNFYEDEEEWKLL